MDEINWYQFLKGVLFIAAFIAIIRYLTFNWAKAVKKVFDNLQDFQVDATVFAGSKGASLAVDNLRKRFCFVKNLKPVIYNFNQLQKCEVIEESRWVIKFSSLWSSKTNRFRSRLENLNESEDLIKMCDKLGFKITMNDSEKSVYDVLVISEQIPENSESYQKAYRVFKEWQRFFEYYAIEKCSISPDTDTIDINVNASSFVNKLASTLLSSGQQISSVADELTKLKSLLDQGVLTPNEFEVQKAKILNR